MMPTMPALPRVRGLRWLIGRQTMNRSAPGGEQCDEKASQRVGENGVEGLSYVAPGLAHAG